MGRLFIIFAVHVCCLSGQACGQQTIPDLFELFPKSQSAPSQDNSVENSEVAVPDTEQPSAGKVLESNSPQQASEPNTTNSSADPNSAESSPVESGAASQESDTARVADVDVASKAESRLSPDEQDAGGPAGEKADAAVRPQAEQPDGIAPADPVLMQEFSKALVIDANGPIFGRFTWYLNQRLDKARREGADLIIVRLTSPGGYVEESIQLGRRLREIDWATTIVFVPEETISGGAIISLGADRIYMRPDALIGDAGPIRMGMDGQFKHAEEKVVSYLAEAIRSLAESNGRPGALAEAMVDRKLNVYEATELATSNRVFITEAERNEDPQGLRYEVGDLVAETGKNRFLTVSGQRALELGLCEGVFASERQLLTSLNIQQLQQTELTWVDGTIYFLNRPLVTAILLILGLIGLYLELAAPGISVAGLTAMLCFGIFFWSHILGGTSGWLEIMLFVLGIVCIICEMFVLPGFGVFGISGIGLVIFSLVMASQDFVLPQDDGQWKIFQRNLMLVLASVFGVLLLFLGHVLFLDSLPGLNRLKLSAPEGEQAASTPASLTGLTRVDGQFAEAIEIGSTGVAESDLRPSGKVRLGSRLLDVITEGDYVNAGTPVVVLRIEGNRVMVRAQSGNS